MFRVGWGRAGLSIACGKIPAMSKKFEAKKVKCWRAVVYNTAQVARHVARRETVQDSGQPKAARPAACMSHFSLLGVVAS